VGAIKRVRSGAGSTKVCQHLAPSLRSRPREIGNLAYFGGQGALAILLPFGHLPAMRLPSGMKLVNLLCGWWTVLVFIFLYLPIGLLVAYSFNKSRLNIEWQGFTFDWYREMFSNEPLMRTLNNSLKIAAVTTLVAVVLGTTSAWLLYRYRYRFKRMWETLLFIPMAIPEVIMGVSFLLFFSAIYPALNGWLDAIFGIPETPRLERGLMTTVIAHTTFCFPFVLVAVQARLADVDPNLEEAAMDLGATPLRAFWKVMVPYMMPAIVSGALMSFTLSMDEVVVTYFVTGPDSKTLPLEVYDNVKKGINPMLNAVSTVFILGTALLVVLAERIRKFNR
jgi:spermidine/putrescine transport system permease protein